MIFSNQEESIRFRVQAREELTDFITDLLNEIQSYPRLEDLPKEAIRPHVAQKIRNDLPAIVSLLLNKSGLIFPNDGHGVNPVTLYYDNFDKWSDKDATAFLAILRKRGLSGGIHKGRVHT